MKLDDSVFVRTHMFASTALKVVDCVVKTTRNTFSSQKILREGHVIGLVKKNCSNGFVTGERMEEWLEMRAL